jgi:hypothetical protein
MNRRIAIAVLGLTMCLPATGGAQQAPKPIPPKPSAAEATFVAKLQQDIPARFATIAAAKKAGYFQYTPEDNTGAISYVNLRVWNSMDLDLPNQLWYDVNGRLLGVDYTLLQDQWPQPPPQIFGYAVDPSRWIHRNAHMHIGFKAADGSMMFPTMPVAKFTAAGGVPDPVNATIPANKAALVAAGVPGLTSPGQVQFVFLHPAMWDLIVWVLPNSDGAFADANPAVTPSKKTGGM